jgi:hypothetical protein
LRLNNSLWRRAARAVAAGKHDEEDVIQYRLSTLLLAFVVVAASLGLCGAWGIVVAAVLLAVAAYATKASYMAGRFVRAFSILGPLLLLCLVFFVGSMAAPSVGRHYTCANQMHNIGLALLTYERWHGNLPPPVTADKQGKPMHSWRVLILPQLERPDLYKAYSLAEPWDGPNNGKLAAMSVHFYACPSSPSTCSSPWTNYVAVTGPGTAWNLSPAEKTSMAARKGRTVMVAEIADANIRWTEPRDMTLDEACGVGRTKSSLAISSNHSTTGACVVFSDGSVAFIPTDVSPEVIRKLLTGDETTWEAYDKQSQTRYKLARAREDDEYRIGWATFATLVLSYVVLLCWPTGTTPAAESQPPESPGEPPPPPAALQ